MTGPASGVRFTGGEEALEQVVSALQSVRVVTVARIELGQTHELVPIGREAQVVLLPAVGAAGKDFPAALEISAEPRMLGRGWI